MTTTANANERGLDVARIEVVSFDLEGVHPHDIGTILDREGVAIRTGQHCAQPVMQVPALMQAPHEGSMNSAPTRRNTSK